jgi:hypothetical protein
MSVFSGNGDKPLAGQRACTAQRGARVLATTNRITTTQNAA